MNGFNSRYSRSKRLRCEINVTPMVDVMLVLLVIFMAASPAVMSSVDINLPKAPTGKNISESKSVSVTVDSEGHLYVGDTKVSNAEFMSRLEVWTRGNKETDIHLRGDKNVDYGLVMSVVSKMGSAGYGRVFLVTENGKN